MNDRMDEPDLNLLLALDALLAERSVTAAARRLGLSPSAMSRSLARLRRATGDPLLVQAGRGLVPTPHAEALAERVPALLSATKALLQPAAEPFEPKDLKRSFVIRAGEGFVDLLAAPLLARTAAVAPGVRLRFAPKLDWDAAPLRDGAIDLEIGRVGTPAPEVKTQLLFRDHYVGVAGIGHPILGAGGVTAERFAAARHVVTSRMRELEDSFAPGPGAAGSIGEVALVVPSYPSALAVVRGSDLLAAVPASLLANALVGDRCAELGVARFALPFAAQPFAISAIWHPRLDADPAHRWLRGILASLAREAYPPTDR